MKQQDLGISGLTEKHEHSEHEDVCKCVQEEDKSDQSLGPGKGQEKGCTATELLKQRRSWRRRGRKRFSFCCNSFCPFMFHGDKNTTPVQSHDQTFDYNPGSLFSGDSLPHPCPDH